LHARLASACFSMLPKLASQTIQNQNRQMKV
jgi:hypothetical protein